MDKPPLYMPQLDGLRALAVASVLVAHFAPASIREIFPWGEAGVRLFFVLSGFLITGILLRARDDIDQERVTLGQSLGHFYARRALRIFAVYYAWTILMWGVGYPFEDTLPFHFTYTSNLYGLIFQGESGAASHYWTLAVEEQFYLTWPLLIFTVPKRHLFGIIVVVAVGAAILRAGIASVGGSYDFVKKFSVFAFDGFALGGLIAFFHCSGRGESARRLARLCASIGIPLLAVAISSKLASKSGIENLSYRSFVHLSLVLVSVTLVVGASKGFAGKIGSFLDLGVLRYIGRISYGIYLFHFFMPWIARVTGLRAVFQAAHIPNLLSYGAMSVALAALSWHLFEAHVNGLKRFFLMSGDRSSAKSRYAVHWAESCRE